MPEAQTATAKAAAKKTAAKATSAAGASPDTASAPAAEDPVLESARAKFPHVTAEYADALDLSDEDLEAIAEGTVSAPPVLGPDFSDVKVRREAGTWVVMPKDHDPSAVRGNRRHFPDSKGE